MRTKMLSVALLASAALITHAQAGGHFGGGGVAGGGHFSGGGPASGRSAALSSSHSPPARNFNGSRMIYSGQRFSSVPLRSRSSAVLAQRYLNSSRPGSIAIHQFTPRNIDRGDRVTRSGNNPRVAQGANRLEGGNRAVATRGTTADRLRHGNNLPANWRNHVVAQHSANWHREWDRRRDHTWNGHHCRFVNGSWVIFDFGFYPWWPYWYPYDYYAYDNYSYPYGYGSDYYDPGYNGSNYYYNFDSDRSEQYYDQNGYESGQYTDSTVAAVQEQLAKKGYYRGEIDGVVGAQTRRAIARYQGRHGLRVTGALTSDTLEALGLGRFASN